MGGYFYGKGGLQKGKWRGKIAQYSHLEQEQALKHKGGKGWVCAGSREESGLLEGRALSPGPITGDKPAERAEFRESAQVGQRSQL